ncbi:hypothetical protein ACSBR1_025475 [Camellia fascicularis]
MVNTSHTRTHVSTYVKGTFGYLDPTYFLARRLTKKLDVYAFGVVLFEVLCARPPIDTSVKEDQMSLALWVQNCIKKRTLDHIIDPSLKGQISPNCLKKIACVLRGLSVHRWMMCWVTSGMHYNYRRLGEIVMTSSVQKTKPSNVYEPLNNLNSIIVHHKFMQENVKTQENYNLQFIEPRENSRRLKLQVIEPSEDYLGR